MTNAPRFRLLAILLLLPVVALAVLAGIGLSERRTAMRAEAQNLCSAQPVAGEWIAALEAAANASPDVWLYDDPPQPESSSPGSQLLQEIKPDDAAGFRQRMEYKKTRYRFTVDSGIPMRAVAGWQWFQLKQKEIDNGANDEPAFLSDVEEFVQVITGNDPSVLTPLILDRLATRFPQFAEKWRDTWLRNEMRRAALETASPVHRLWQNSGLEPPGAWSMDQLGSKPLELVSLRGPSGAAVLPKAVLLPAGAVAAGGRVSPAAITAVFAFNLGNARVLLGDELRDTFRLLQQKARHSLPSWAAVNVRLKPGTPTPDVEGDRLTSLGDAMPDVLSSEDMGFCIIEIGPRNPDWLLRDYNRLVWWAAALIGTALLTSVAGLWLVRRTLLRERKLGEMKSQFVSSVSHELRAPVGSMRLMAEALASGKVSGPPADEFHRLMASEGARLSGLIENVLDFARIDQGRKRYHLAETDVTALVQDAVKLMTPPAEERGQKILTDIQPLPFVPQVDAPALQQALINLLENALKFSAPHSEVMVTLAGDPPRNTWSLSVTDHGPGIPKSEHARIFDRFYRPGDELRRETTGSGIGLTIVKHVVEGHGGRITLHSELGKGSTFTMEFPVSRS